MPRRAHHPVAPIGNVPTAALLGVYAVVCLWGTELIGWVSVPTSLIWPAPGIGLALVLLRGTHVWPWIFVIAGACSVWALQGSPLPVAVSSGLLSGGVAALESVLVAILMWALVGEAYFERASAFVLAMSSPCPWWPSSPRSRGFSRK